MKYENGSIATIQYYCNGSRSFTKEHLQIYFGGKIVQLDNFKSLKSYGFHFPGFNFFQVQDKGHGKQFAELLNPDSKEFGALYLKQIFHTSELCFQIVDKLSRNQSTPQFPQ